MIYLDQNGNQLLEGDLMEGCCDDCAGEPAFWHACEDEEGQFCADCIQVCAGRGVKVEELGRLY